MVSASVGYWWIDNIYRMAVFLSRFYLCAALLTECTTNVIMIVESEDVVIITGIGGRKGSRSSIMIIYWFAAHMCVMDIGT